MVLTLLIFLSVSLGIVAGYHLLAGVFYPDDARVRDRLAREFDPSRPAATPSLLFKKLDGLTLDPSLHDFDLDAPAAAPPAGFRGQMESLLHQANVPLSFLQLWLLSAGLGLAIGALGVGLGGPLLGVPAGIVAAVLPLGYIWSRVGARRDKLLRQLPAAFELMARVLRAGSSVPQTLQAVSEAFEDPLATEFADCQKQLDLGLRPEVVYQQMAQRTGVLELRIFVMAMMIQRQTGGNLSEILDRIANLIRSRLRMQQQVRSLTAEGRLQGLTLAALPFFVFGVMLVINHDYAMALLDHVWLLIATIASVLVGVLWIRHIVNFEP